MQKNLKYIEKVGINQLGPTLVIHYTRLISLDGHTQPQSQIQKHTTDTHLYIHLTKQHSSLESLKMGLGLLASKALLRSSRPLKSHSFIRTIVSTPELHNSEAAAAVEPPPAPDRTPVGGARVHFANPDDAIEVFVDGFAVKIPKGMTVLQACEVAGVDIPRFCYHSRLSIAGNCRMCLVEVEKSPKPVASCAMPALPGFVFNYTHTYICISLLLLIFMIFSLFALIIHFQLISVIDITIYWLC